MKTGYKDKLQLENEGHLLPNIKLQHIYKYMYIVSFLHII